MYAWTFFLLLQEPALERQVDEFLRQFQQGAQEEAARVLLTGQLENLGGAALGPVAARLAADLRDGRASPAAAALLDVLMGHPESWGPLQAAFSETGTSPSGRIELASALVQLMDTMSWRPGLLAVADDRAAPWGDRLHAAALLREVGDERAGPAFARLAAEAPGRSKSEQQEWADLLDEAAPRPAIRMEEPRVIVEDEARRAPLRPIVKKRETEEGAFLTIRNIAAGGALLGMLALLVVLRRRSP